VVAAKRETTGKPERSDFPTAAAVAEEIHADWYLVRDPAGVGDRFALIFRGSRASRATPGYRPRRHPATVQRVGSIRREHRQTPVAIPPLASIAERQHEHGRSRRRCGGLLRRRAFGL